MTDLNPKGLEAGVVSGLATMERMKAIGHKFSDPYLAMAISQDAIQAYIAASPTPPVEAEAVVFRHRDPTDTIPEEGEWIYTERSLPSSEPLYSASTVSALQARVRELEEMQAWLTLIGGQLVNCAFNPSQPSSAVYDRDREVLKELCKKWDAARSALVSHNPPEMRHNAPSVQQDGSKP